MTVPAAPTNLQASVKGSTVILTWKNGARAQGAVWQLDGKDAGALGWPSPTPSTASIPNVPSGTHMVGVCDYDGSGRGPFDKVSVTVAPVAPPPPQPPAPPSTKPLRGMFTEGYTIAAAQAEMPTGCALGLWSVYLVNNGSDAAFSSPFWMVNQSQNPNNVGLYLSVNLGLSGETPASAMGGSIARSVYYALGQTLVANGWGIGKNPAVRPRIGWEADSSQGFYRSPTTGAQYRTAYRAIASQIRKAYTDFAAANPGVVVNLPLFDFNVTGWNANNFCDGGHYADWYPGDDVVATCSWDGYGAGTLATAQYAGLAAAMAGANPHYADATTKVSTPITKPWGIGEWAISDTPGSDNAAKVSAYVASVGQVVNDPAHPAAYHVYWSSSGNGWNTALSDSVWPGIVEDYTAAFA